MSKFYDVVIVGGGIVGLWVARAAAQAGMQVALVEARRCGSGASGGVLGALLPHLPTAIKEKNQFQFDALIELPDLIGDLEKETGLSTGFVRCGRVMPIRRESFLRQAERAVQHSADVWRSVETGLKVEIVDASDLDGWLDADAAPMGAVRDNLSARVDPRSYIHALEASLEGRADVFHEFDFANFDASTGQVRDRNGAFDIRAGAVVLAAGFRTFELAERLINVPLGHGVKGQAAVFDIDVTQRDLPVIYDNGVYIVHHGAGRFAVGSSSENDWEGETDSEPDKARLFIDRARELCPPLRGVKPSSYWAGVRPRAFARDPIVGCLDPVRRLYVASGGFKISFGIAHRLARCLVEELTGAVEPTWLPDRFAAAHHLNEAVKKQA